MRAIVCNAYGGPEVLSIEEVAVPQLQKDEVLVKVKAASLTTAEAMMRKGQPKFGRLFLGIRRPKHPIMGTGFSGEIVAVGEDVTQWQTGQQVFGETTVKFSTNAEFVSVKESGVIMEKPDTISHVEAAPMCDGAITSLNFLTNVYSLKSGEEILINGASGSLGVAAVQIAKSKGAIVTTVCSTANVEFVKSLGADHVIDYRKEDFTQYSHRFDVVFDTVGKSSFSKCKRILRKKGVYMSPVLSLELMFQMMRTGIFGKKKAKFQATGLKKTPELLELLAGLLDLSKEESFRMVVDKTYTLDEAKAAHEYIDGGHKRGNLVLTVAAD